MIIASMSSFLGSMWFAGMMCFVGYLAGCVMPVSKIKEKFVK
tara:strand:- start:349 stop:474 length:126 start_codon:yes stop_codon:yes gene_type:complete